MDIASGIVRVESGLDEAMSGPGDPRTAAAKSGKPERPPRPRAEMRDVQARGDPRGPSSTLGARPREAIVEFVNDPATP